MEFGSPAWYSLSRQERLRRITTVLGIPCDRDAAERLSTVPPAGWTDSLSQHSAHRDYGFPASPTPGDSWTAWDGTGWTFSHLAPWWNRSFDE